MATMDKRIAVVTGANRGIGYEISRQLANQGLRVILTSRDETRGLEALAELQKNGLDVLYHRLDVTDGDSVAALTDFVERESERVDVLVNNAGVLIDGRGTSVLKADLDIIHETMEVNFYGALRMCQAIVPLMRRNQYGRIVNMSSGLGQLDDMGNGTPGYRVSKAALNTLTRMVAAATKDQDILINSMCPGWVRTDMGGPNATRSAEQGAETAVWLATLPYGGPSGGFFRDKQPIPW